METELISMITALPPSHHERLARTYFETLTARVPWLVSTPHRADADALCSIVSCACSAMAHHDHAIWGALLATDDVIITLDHILDTWLLAAITVRIASEVLPPPLDKVAAHIATRYVQAVQGCEALAVMRHMLDNCGMPNNIEWQTLRVAWRHYTYIVQTFATIQWEEALFIAAYCVGTLVISHPEMGPWVTSWRDFVSIDTMRRLGMDGSERLMEERERRYGQTRAVTDVGEDYLKVVYQTAGCDSLLYLLNLPTGASHSHAASPLIFAVGTSTRIRLGDLMTSAGAKSALWEAAREYGGNTEAMLQATSCKGHAPAAVATLAIILDKMAGCEPNITNSDWLWDVIRQRRCDPSDVIKVLERASGMALPHPLLDPSALKIIIWRVLDEMAAYDLNTDPLPTQSMEYTVTRCRGVVDRMNLLEPQRREIVGYVRKAMWEVLRTRRDVVAKARSLDVTWLCVLFFMCRLVGVAGITMEGVADVYRHHMLCMGYDPVYIARRIFVIPQSGTIFSFYADSFFPQCSVLLVGVTAGVVHGEHDDGVDQGAGRWDATKVIYRVTD